MNMQDLRNSLITINYFVDALRYILFHNQALGGWMCVLSIAQQLIRTRSLLQQLLRNAPPPKY